MKLPPIWVFDGYAFERYLLAVNTYYMRTPVTSCMPIWVDNHYAVQFSKGPYIETIHHRVQSVGGIWGGGGCSIHPHSMCRLLWS